MRYIHTLRPVITVATDGTVGLRLAGATATAGLFVVEDCAPCRGIDLEHGHRHRAWRLQTQWGYLLDDLRLTRRRDAMEAASRLGELDVDWTDAMLVVRADAGTLRHARELLARHGLAAAA